MSGAVSPRARPGWWGVAAIVVLAAVPVAAMVVPTSMGSVPINGDNPVLGYPLRVLSGRLLAEGHLPLWDPYLWSGVPLLAGFNAGALFPATALFAVLPPVSAWVVTVILVYDVTAIGFYVFLRAAGRSVAAAFLGSLSFSFAGFMTSQFGHIDLVEAVALAPWLLLALHRLARPRSPRDRGWGWTLLLGACFALVILAGEPEAMLDLGVLAGVYALAMAWHQPGRGIRVLLLAALGVAGGVAVGAVQWLPGLALASHSQRAVTSYAYFGSGSLPPRLSALLVLPYLLGGYGRLGQIGYSGPYNLAELNGYVGILPVVAAFALFGRRARRPVDRGSWIWYLVIAVGLVLAMGSFTPLGHWLYQIPFYGQQRTQSRNLMDVDVGLAALLALWVDRLMDRRRAPAGAEGAGPAGLVGAAPAGAEDAGPAGLVSAAPAGAEDAGPAWLAAPGGRPAQIGRALARPLRLLARPLRLLARPLAVLARPLAGAGRLAARALAGISYLLALIPVAAVVAAWVLARGHAREVLLALGGVHVPASSAGPVRHYLTQALAVALAAGVVAATARWWPRWLRLPALGVVVVADLALFGAAQYTFIGGPPSSMTASRQPAVRLAAVNGRTGRFGIYVPGPGYGGLVYRAGGPDLNIVDRVPSVDGYGSLVGARYAAATGTHGAGVLSAPLAGTTFDQLDLHTLVAPPASFRVPVPSGAATRAVPVVGPRSVHPGKQTSWWIGDDQDVATVELADRAPATVANRDSGLEVGLVTGSGRVVWSSTGLRAPASPGAPIGAEVAGFVPPVSAVGVVVANHGTGIQVVSAPVVTAGAGQQWMLEGPLSEVVLPPHWTYIGPDAGLALFRNTRARGPLWVEGRHGGPAPAGASARVLLTSGPGSQTVGVTTSAPALLVRSVANYPGWSATVARTATGSGRTVPVVAVGLVQGVRVPAGTSIVTWTYRPRELTTGLEIAGGGLAGAAAVAVWIWLWRAGRWLARRWARRRRALREERAGPADVPPGPRGGVQPTPVA